MRQDAHDMRPVAESDALARVCFLLSMIALAIYLLL